MPKGEGLILVIVESPGKIEKIQHILGDGYIVLASVGHIIDLDKSNMSIDFEDNYKPIYKIIDGKYDVVEKIKKAYYKSTDLLIATDEDREGEMIAWSIASQLKVKTPKRITFNSITKEELLKAVKKPGKINDNIVDAQKLRRMLDRIIGYKLSPLLWKSMGGGLSAGRVQSVVVKLINEKEQEISNFFSAGTASFFKTTGDFSFGKSVMKSQLYTTKKQESIEEIKEEDSEDDEKPTKGKKKVSKKKEIEEDCEDDEKPTKGKKKVVKKQEDDEEEIVKTKGEIARIPNKQEATHVMELIVKSKFTVSNTVTKESIRQPSAPFITSTLQQEASTKYGFGSKRTMMAAQHLYEAGHITYMRTDSVNLSAEALKLVGEYIVSKYGKEYHRQTEYKSKSKNAQEAHEAIRPTDPKVTGISENSGQKISKDEIKLYTLIWKRAVASQMAPAKFDVTTVSIEASKLDDYYFLSHLEENTFLGYLAVYNLADNKDEVDENNEDNDIKNKLDKIEIPKIGTKLKPSNITCTESYKNPPGRYNEASLVKKLEALSIGRPSTYAAIIDKIQNVKYVKKEDVPGEDRDSFVMKWDGNEKSNVEIEKKKISLGKEKNRFIPTDIGIFVVTFLEQHFKNIMDYKFTADMEQQLDDIAEGKLTLFKVIDKFWKDFSELVNNLDKSIVTKDVHDPNAREVGIHPETGMKIIATLARYGPMIKMEEEGSKKPRTAPIKKPLTIKTITVSDAVELFSFPKNLGRHKGKIVSLNRGKYGYYVTLGKEDIRVSVKIEDDEVDKFKLEDAILALEQKKEGQLWSEADNKYRYTLCNAKYGMCIMIKPLIQPKTVKKPKFVSLPKDVKQEDLTLEKVLEIVANDSKRKKEAVQKNKQSVEKKEPKESSDKSNEKKDKSDSANKDTKQKKSAKKESGDGKVKPNKKTTKK